MNAQALLDAGIEVAYQPIVQLASGSVIAYEALARPRHDDAPGPQAYFAELDRCGLRLAGEWSALKDAVEGAHARSPRTKLFVNASPSTLVDSDFDVRELVAFAGQHALGPEDLVVEVTEAEAIGDLEALAHRVQEMHRLGVGLAVDDAGAGHSSFRVITRLRPSFIKLDRDLVTHVDRDGARHAFIGAMVRFSRQIGSRLIAEGIETDSELISLAELGVDAGQGFFLARPAIGELVYPSPDARRMIAVAAQRLRLGAAKVTVGQLARQAAEIDAFASTTDAYRRFQSDPTLGVLALTEPGGTWPRVVGQLTRRALEGLLAAPDAWTRLSGNTVGQLADRQPLTVLADLDVVEVAGIISARHPQAAGDDLVVTGPRGELVGVVAVRDVLRTLAQVRHQGDLDVHPLSGLLGRAWMEGELPRRLATGEPTTMVFVDVDGFSLVNDLGGFSAGDDVIRALGRCIGGVAAAVEGAAVAHVGADDFILAVPSRHHDEVVGELVDRVEHEVVPLVRTLLGLHPGGREAERVALSIAAVDLDGHPPAGQHHLTWVESLLSPLMQTAKGHEGHACIHRSGASTALSTWAVRPRVQRTVDIGLAEPAVVLGALDLLEEAWVEMLSVGSGPQVRGVSSGAHEMQRLLTHYAGPLRERAQTALARGSAALAVRLEGEEEELLALLDRVALLTERMAAGQTPQRELALLDRLQRQRARTLTRQDRLSGV